MGVPFCFNNDFHFYLLSRNYDISNWGITTFTQLVKAIDSNAFTNEVKIVITPFES